MSLVSLTEAHGLTTGIEVEGIVKSMEKGCEVWIDYLQDYRRVCNAKLTDGTGNMINIAFWGSDISKVRNNLRIHITDAKWDECKKILYKTKIGVIVVSGFNPNLIFDDIVNLKKRNKITSFKEYYNHVKNNPSNYYLGAEKKVYLQIGRSLWTIEKLQSKFRNIQVSSAIRYLHNKITLSAEQIHSILKIFNIIIPCDRILRNSNDEKLNKIRTIVPETTFEIIIKDDDPESIQLETICEKTTICASINELPNEISFDESLENNDMMNGVSLNSRIKYKYPWIL